MIDVGLLNMTIALSVVGICGILAAVFFGGFFGYGALILGGGIVYYLQKKRIWVTSRKILFLLVLPVIGSLFFLFNYKFSFDERLIELDFAEVCARDQERFCNVLPKDTKLFQDKKNDSRYVALLKTSAKIKGKEYPNDTSFIFDKDWNLVNVVFPNENPNIKTER